VDMFRAGIIDPAKVTCHGRRCSGCGIIAVNMSRCVAKSAKPHAPWRPAAASRSATARGARRGKTGNTGRKTRGLQYCGHRAGAVGHAPRRKNRAAPGHCGAILSSSA
jgi:hypothetical protein